MEYKFSDITGKIIAAAFEVHNALKNGFPEIIYHRAFEFELKNAGLQVQSEFEMPVYYKSQKIGIRRVDFFVENIIAVEIKAIILLEDAHIAQAINYLEAYNMELGLLINFGCKSLEFRRLYNNKYKPKISES